MGRILEDSDTYLTTNMLIDQTFRVQQLLAIVAEFLCNIENPKWFSIAQSNGKTSCYFIF